MNLQIYLQNNRLIYGDWFDYTLGWWNLKSCKNVLFLKYEDMLKDAEKGIRQVYTILSCTHTMGCNILYYVMLPFGTI